MNRISKTLLAISLTTVSMAAMAQSQSQMLQMSQTTQLAQTGNVVGQPPQNPMLIKKGTPSVQNVKCDDIVSVGANGDVRYKDGAATLTLRVADLYYVAKPRRMCKELTDGDAAIAAKNWAEAYKKFADAETKYGKMGWDANAIYNQGLALTSLKRDADAVKVLERIRNVEFPGDRLSDWKKADYDAALSMLVLIYASQGNSAKVDDTTKFILTSGSAAVPAALIAQGDLLYKAGKKRDAVYKYAEAAVMYENSPVAPRAFCMVANTMKELGDSRGVSFAEKLRSKYPESEWISKLK